MIIRTQEDVTPAVLSEIARAPDPRLREIMSALVRHLHAFCRAEVKLTEGVRIPVGGELRGGDRPEIQRKPQRGRS